MSAHFVTITCEPTDYWPTLTFHCAANDDAPCRNVCPEPDCEEGCDQDAATHPREPVESCIVLDWLNNSDEPAGDVPSVTKATLPIHIKWGDSDEGPLWSFAPQGVKG